MDGARILLVDDDAQLRRFMRDVLEAEGCVLALASNGAEAIEVIEQDSYDLVISDIVMPETDGVELLMHLRRLDPSFAAIAISGGGLVNAHVYLKIASKIGASVLPKPFSADELVAAVAGVLRARAGT